MAAGKRLESLSCVITGGAGGIGEATTRLFVENGAKVVVADIQDELGRALEAELGSNCRFVHCDVRSEEDIAAAVDFAVAEFGSLDIMFNNAGVVGSLGPIDETPAAEFDFTHAVNLRSAFLGVKHAARVMKPAKKGSILCTSSVCGVVGGLGPHAYSMSKAGMVGLVKSAAAELRHFGIRVNAISPPMIPTPMVSSILSTLFDKHVSLEEAREIVAKTSLIQGVEPTTMDIANAALFLASKESRYITAHNLVVDGGLTTCGPDERAFKSRKPLLREAGASGLPNADQ